MSVSGSGISPDGGYWEIDHGWDVFGADGDKVGDVADVQTNYITVSKGFLFKTDMYIPVFSDQQCRTRPRLPERYQARHRAPGLGPVAG